MKDEPVWQSDQWKQARIKLLQDQCQQCSSSEKLSLVHLWKPPKYRTLRIKIEEEIITELVTTGKLSPFDTSSCEEERFSCPNCNSISLRKRKTKTPTYKCSRCAYEFDNPTPIIIRDEYLFNRSYKEWKTTHLGHMTDVIEDKIRDLQEQYDQDYRSGKGTTTLCGKCAFLWTQKQMKLCQTCQSKYHKRKFDQCYDCYQKTDLVTCEKCSIEKIPRQPGDINICEKCLEKMWDELTE